MLACLGLLAATASPTHVHHVDLTRAALALEEGRAARDEILAAREARTAALQRKRQRLLARRGGMPPSAYAAAVDALNAEFAAAEAELERMQVELLGPMTRKLEGLMAAAGAPDAVVLDVDEAGLVRPDRLCDRTAWLVEAYRGEDKAPARIAACQRRGFARVRVADAVKALPAAEAEQRRLKALQAKRQETVNRLKREIDALTRKAAETKDPRLTEEVEAQRRALDQQFLRFQSEIEAEETAASTRLRRLVTDAAARAARAHPEVLFYTGAPLDRKPACDATTWIVELAKGEGDVEALPGGCRG